MYILPHTEKGTVIIVTQGKPVSKAVRKSLISKGAENYFIVEHESEEPKEKLKLQA
jgi:electron transfer flavoprotein alpha/beta subunit